LKERNHSGDPDRRIIHLPQDSLVVGCSEHLRNILVPQKAIEFIYQLSDYWLLKKASAPLSHSAIWAAVELMCFTNTMDYSNSLGHVFFLNNEKSTADKCLAVHDFFQNIHNFTTEFYTQYLHTF
jgi:hypothetical protein